MFPTFLCRLIHGLKHLICMKRFLVLPRISALSFALFPMEYESVLWMAVISVLTILPLVIYLIVAIHVTRKTHTRFLTNLFGYEMNFVDMVIAGLGVFIAFYFDMNSFSIIWIVALCCILIEMLVLRKDAQRK